MCKNSLGLKIIKKNKKLEIYQNPYSFFSIKIHIRACAKRTIRIRLQNIRDVPSFGQANNGKNISLRPEVKITDH